MKDKSEISIMLKEAGILFAITLLAGLLLGFVYELTKEPIRIQQEKAINEACMAVLPAANDSTVFTEYQYTVDAQMEREFERMKEDGVTIGKVYEAKNGSQFLGYVVESTSSKGYGGNIVLYVGITTDGTVGGVSILEIKETAGLGMEAPNVLAPQFAGKKVDHFVFTKTGATEENEVDAITSATITTRAVTNAVNGALDFTHTFLKGGEVNE